MNAEELSPMHVAAQAGHSKVAAWLQREGLSVAEPASSQMQPIHLAASNGHLEVTDWLLQQDTNLATATARGGITPLHMAALNGRPEVATLLLARRCSASVGVPFLCYLSSFLNFWMWGVHRLFLHVISHAKSPFSRLFWGNRWKPAIACGSCWWAHRSGKGFAT